MLSFLNPKAKIPKTIIKNHRLYHFTSCPFCHRVRSTIAELKIDIEMRDIQKNTEFRNELRLGGGKTTVPCLRIENEEGVNWMYESLDIINYLKKNFSND